MKKITFLFGTALLLLVFSFSTVVLVQAGTHEAISPQSQGGGSTPPSQGGGSSPTSGSFGKLENPLKAESVTDLLFLMVDIAIFIGVIIAVFMFIYIGFKFVLAQGNDKALGEAKSWFLYAVIGTAVLISSKVIVEVIKNTFISAGVVQEKYFKEPGT